MSYEPNGLDILALIILAIVALVAGIALQLGILLLFAQWPLWTSVALGSAAVLWAIYRIATLEKRNGN